MATTLTRIPAGAPAAERIAALNEDGAVILEDLLPPATLAQINQELDPFVEEASPKRSFLNPALAWFFGDRTRHVTGVCSKSPCFVDEVLCNPGLLDVCDGVLGPSCARYQLNLAHVLDRGPGAKAQILHRDELVWIHVPRPHPELQVASLVALVDFTADNGATQVVPGSHRWPHEREAKPDEIATAEMSAGSAVLYLGSTLHRGGGNVTADIWRRGIHLSFVLGWLRTEENNYLATPPDVARKLSPKARDLIGYGAHDALSVGGGYLGSLDLRDPAEMLEKGEL